MQPHDPACFLSQTRPLFHRRRCVCGRGRVFRLPPQQISTVILCAMLFLVVSGRASGQNAVLTQHNDNERTGAYLSELTLTPGRVGSRGMRRKFWGQVDGDINAQPLYVPGVLIGGARHNVVYVATRKNTVYAFDADSESSSTAPSGVLWPPKHFADPAPSLVAGNWGGIGSTPVIDLETNTMYVVYATTTVEVPGGEACAGGTNRDAAFWLAALDIRTGQMIRTAGRPNPVELAARAPSTVAPGYVDFCAIDQWQRPGLLLTRDAKDRTIKYLYIAFGSRWLEGLQNYHGWVMRYGAQTFTQQGVFCTTPNRRGLSEGAGIWQGGAGLAADDEGNAYFTTGNSSSDPGSFGDSIVKLTPVRDRFGRYSLSAIAFDAQADDPTHAMSWRQHDIDLGSGGVILIPDSRHLVGGGKTGVFYLLDYQGGMRKLQSFKAFSNTYEPDDVNRYADWMGGPHLHGAPTYWQTDSYSFIYHWAENDYLKRFIYDRTTGRIGEDPYLGPIRALQCLPSSCLMPGGMISLSANGTRDGILWATLPVDSSRGRLLAFDALDLRLLWQTPLPSIAHFVAPTIADGKVFVVTAGGQMLAYELNQPRSDCPAPLCWIDKILCLGDCGIKFRKPDDGKIVNPVDFSNPEYSPNFVFDLVIDGSIRDIALNAQQMVKSLITDGGKLLAFTSEGKEMPLELSTTTEKNYGGFKGCSGCLKILKEGGVISGVVLEKGRLRALIVGSGPLTGEGRQTSIEPQVKVWPETGTFGEPHPHVRAIMQMIDKESVSKLMPPTGNVVLFTARGEGFQVYVCRATNDAPGECEWVLKTSEAVLSDDVGTRPNHAFYGLGEELGKLYDGPTWEANDRSRVTGEIQAQVKAPKAASLPWLLLKVSQSKGKGSFSLVTYVQQVNTVGGEPPSKIEGKAGVGMEKRVPYTANYVFYGIKP
jgi:outer membrane protein assembly factor BamB